MGLVAGPSPAAFVRHIIPLVAPGYRGFLTINELIAEKFRPGTYGRRRQRLVR